MIGELQARTSHAVRSFTDRFTGNRKAGEVIGTRTADGILRRGVDVEKCIGIDNGALRIQPLIQPGWGRAGIAYEPYRRQNGLTFAVFMLNGHNTAQTGVLMESLKSRIGRWWLGSETYGRGRRIVQWIASGRIARAIRQFRWWYHINKSGDSLTKIDENLAVGWFDKEVPANPLSEGNAFVMHATGGENGELWTTVGTTPLPAIRSVQNLQIYYVIILRAKGAAYYVASVQDANGLPAYPQLRPLAIDPFHDEENVYPGIHQSVLGQIGFRLDTRVYGTRVEQLAEFADWYGSAHAADRLGGGGFLRASEAEIGGIWRNCGDEENLTLLDPGATSGLVHVIAHTDAYGPDVAAGLIWRYRDSDNYWRIIVGNSGCQLAIRENGVWTELAASEKCHLETGTANSIQLLDDGEAMSFHLRGELLFDKRFRDRRLREATGTGLYASKTGIRVESFEAHPRTISLPQTLRMGEPWLRTGSDVVVTDSFSGPAGDLAGRITTTGSKTWQKRIGVGTIEVTGSGSARIKASVEQPNPGRTAYTIAWDHPEFADISVEITPAGTGPGQKEHGLCGLILWQDPDNYIIINIWLRDVYGGASISCFFHLDGFEDLYDAIWSNVGKRVYYNVPMMLRVVCDGTNFAVFIGDEPVLFRALTDVYPAYETFSIQHVGLLANWEWGNDTGSTFRNFVGRI